MMHLFHQVKESEHRAAAGLDPSPWWHDPKLTNFTCGLIAGEQFADIIAREFGLAHAKCCLLYARAVRTPLV
jgi:hypothetical protein